MENLQIPHTTRGIVDAVLDKAGTEKIPKRVLADKLGVSLQTLYHWQRGVFNPDGDNTLKLLRFLNNMI